MKWIVLAIFLFIVPYTYLTLRYRKPGPGYLPYEDAREKARIVQVGYRRVTLSAYASDALQPRWGGAATDPAPGGWPADLRGALIEVPPLPADIGAVHAPYETAPRERCAIEFSCTLADGDQRLAGARLYIKDQSAYLVTDFEKAGEGLSARSPQSVVAVSLPADALPPGRYRITVLGARRSRAWTLQVH